jgi:hypothetical protein
MADRSLKTVRIIVSTASAIAFWLINAIVMRARLEDAAMVRAFLWNMLLFAVVITAIHAAAVGWRGLARLSPEDSDRPQAKRPIRVQTTGFLFGLLGLGCGIGLTIIIVRSSMDGHAWTLFTNAMRLILPMGIAFSAVGSIAAGLSLALVSALIRKPGRSAGIGLAVLLVLVYAAWFAVSWFAVVSGGRHIPVV